MAITKLLAFSLSFIFEGTCLCQHSLFNNSGMASLKVLTVALVRFLINRSACKSVPSRTVFGFYEQLCKRVYAFL